MERPGSEEAFDALARGGLAGAESTAWTLLERAWPALFGRVQGMLRGARLPEDLRGDCGQAVLVRVWRFRSSYRGTSAAELAAWMNRITRNEIARLSAGSPGSQARGGDEPDALETAPDPGAPPDERVAALDDLRALEDCMDTLASRLREVIELLYGDAPLSEREAVEVLGVSKSHVHTLRRKALDALARCLERKGVG